MYAKNEYMGQFSAALRAAMRDLKWTQSDIVTKFQAVSQPTLSRYLAGSDLPKLGSLEAICKHMPERLREDVTAAYLTDHIPPSATELIAVTSLKDGKPVPPKYVYGKAAPGSLLRKDLDILERRALDDPNLAKALNYLAASLEGGSPSPEYYNTEGSEHYSVKEDPAVQAAEQQLRDSGSQTPPKPRPRRASSQGDEPSAQ